MLPLLVLALALKAPAAAPPPPAPPAPRSTSAAADQGPLHGDWSKASGKRVSIAVSMSVDDALQHIADAAGWNVVLNTGRAGNRTLTLRLREVPVEDALRATLTGSGLVATRTGGTVVVAEEAEATPAESPVLSGLEGAPGGLFNGSFNEEGVGDALREIAAGANLSIVLPRGNLHGTVTATFKDVPWADALRAVLEQGGLSAEVKGRMVVVRRGRLRGLLPPGLGREAQRAAEQALSDADEAMQDAQITVERRERTGSDEKGRDREVTGSDLTIHPGESVRDVNVVKGNLRLQSGAQARDAAVVLGSLTLDTGASTRDAVAVLGKATLMGGASARQVVSVLGGVEIGPGADVEQDVISIGGPLHVDPSAHVGGTTHAISLPSLPELPGKVALHLLPDIETPFGMVLGILVRFAVLFVLGLIVLSVVPRRLEAVSGAMVARPWRSLFAGMLGSVGMVVLAVLLAVTVIGLLLIPVQALLVVSGGVMGITALTLYLGRALPFPPSRRTQVLELAAGTLIFSVVAEVPVLGGMAWVAAWLLTFGAVLRTRFGQPPAGVLPTTPAPPPAMAS